MIKIAPSILAADQMRLGEEVERVLEAGCDLLHVDIMDGHFVPNMSFGPDLAGALHAAFPDLPLDIHLMLDEPEKYIERFAKSAWGITIHEEIPGDVEAILRAIHGMHVRTGLSLKPDTPAEKAVPFFGITDMILVMTVEPGFGGQPLRWDMMDKIRKLRELGYRGLIEADGGINRSNIRALAEAGLDIAVMGTTVFTSRNLKQDLAEMHAVGRGDLDA